jgi:outer membrane biosynthesis protein TonB
MVLETEYEKKSFTITTILFILLFLFMFFFVIYPLPGDELREEGGGGGGEIAINFGNSETGSGTNYKSTDLSTPAAKTPTVKETPQVKEVLTQNTVDAPAISQVKIPVKTTTPKVVEPVKPQPSKSTSDALSNLLNGNNKGDGDDKTGGNKGQTTGNPNATGYSGGGGSGSGSGGGQGSGQGIGQGSGYGSGTGSGTGSGNYQLGNRKALSKPQPNYTCNEQGVVVVQIHVDKNGNVIEAQAGVRGTTNSARCLLEQAEIAAKKTKWESDSDAPTQQIGKIIYNFKLTD